MHYLFTAQFLLLSIYCK